MPTGIYERVKENSGQFKKGQTPHNKGKKSNKPAWNKGKKATKTVWNKGLKGLTPWNKGRKETRPEVLKRQSDSHCGIKMPPFTEEHKRKIGLSNSGEQSFNWKGGITKQQFKIRNSFDYKEWRRKCLERDNWTCQISKVKGGKINVHHINNFADNPELIFDINNGITISKELHEKFHSIYKRKNNTQEQLDEFILNYVNTTDNISRGTTKEVGGEIELQSGDSEINS